MDNVAACPSWAISSVSAAAGSQGIKPLTEVTVKLGTFRRHRLNNQSLSGPGTKLALKTFMWERRKEEKQGEKSGGLMEVDSTRVLSPAFENIFG